MKINLDAASLIGQPTIKGRRKRGNKASRVPEIIEASIQILAKEGYANYSVNRVASDVGIMLSTVQHYFPTRQHLLKATIQEFLSRYIGRYALIGKNPLVAPPKRLDAIVDDYIQNAAVNGFILEVWALAEHEEFVAAIVREALRQFQGIFEAIISQTSPTMIAEERSARALMITTHLCGLTVVLRNRSADSAFARRVANGTKAVWHALLAAD